MCGLGTGTALPPPAAPARRFRVTFEERRWIIGNGLRSPESPSGHLPARPARQHLPRALPKAELPPLLITPQTMLRPWDPVRGSGAYCTDGKTKQPPLHGTGKGVLGRSLFAHPRHKRRHPQTGALESCVLSRGTRTRCLPCPCPCTMLRGPVRWRGRGQPASCPARCLAPCLVPLAVAVLPIPAASGQPGPGLVSAAHRAAQGGPFPRQRARCHPLLPSAHPAPPASSGKTGFSRRSWRGSRNGT